MSDYVFANSFNKTIQDIIKSNINGYYFVDFGIISAISSDKTRIDVIHAIRQKLNGKELPPTQTKNIEVIWGGCQNIQIKYDLQVNDTVLLVGQRDYIETVNGLTQNPSTANIQNKYTQECLLAIPFGVVSNPKTSIEISSSKVTIDSQQDLDLSFNGNTITTSSTSLMINNNLEILK